MKSNLLPFPARPRLQQPVTHPDESAEVVSLEVYRRRTRCLRTATGVFFVSPSLAAGDELTAA